MCPVLVPSELLLSTHLPTSEGWTAELTVGLCLVVSMTGFEPTQVHLARFCNISIIMVITDDDDGEGEK